MREMPENQPPVMATISPRIAVAIKPASDPDRNKTDSWIFESWATHAGSGRLFVDIGTGQGRIDASSLSQQARLVATMSGRQFEVTVVPSESPAHIDLRLTTPAQIPVLDAIVGSQRKRHHIEICEKSDVESSDRDNGLGAWGFMPCALPELAWSDLDTRRTFLGREFSAPILITGMTGGIERGRDINRNLARAAAEANIPMGVGSQRIALEDPGHAAIFDVKRDVPEVFLIGNIGAAQLVGGRTHQDARDLCLRAVEMIEADALAIHINVLQELIQTEGDRDFRGVQDCIRAIVSDFPVPVVVKEVGAGMDPLTAARLASSGITAIDVGGRGGTSWGWIEGLRAGDPATLELARAFRDWGLTTGDALTLCHTAVSLPLIATGGLRSGVDVAKAIALGATMAGIGLPLFKAALADSASVSRELDALVKGLKTVMMCTGARTLNQLKTTRRLNA